MRSFSSPRWLIVLGLLFATCPPASADDPRPSPAPASGATASEVGEVPEGAALPPADAAGEESATPGKLSLSADLTYASKYLFQGIDYSDGRSVLQPDLVASSGPFSVVAWGNFQPDLGDINEIDLSVKVAGSIQKLSISPGYTYLHYPNRIGWDPSQELFVDLGLDAPLHPSLSLHFDVDAGDGLYATLGLSRTLKEPVTAAVNLFYQDHYYEMTGFPAMELKLSGSWSFQGLSFAPSISRFATWENDDFRHDAATPASWLFSLNVARTLF